MLNLPVAGGEGLRGRNTLRPVETNREPNQHSGVVGCRKAPLQRLEPCAVKIAWRFLRGRRCSNVLLLPDFPEATPTSGLLLREVGQTHSHLLSNSNYRLTRSMNLLKTWWGCNRYQIPVQECMQILWTLLAMLNDIGY